MTTFQDLPDTIGVKEYMDWRNCGRMTADAAFHSKGFPRLWNESNKLQADKRAVLLFELGLTKEDRELVLKEIARELVSREMKGGENNVD